MSFSLNLFSANSSSKQSHIASKAAVFSHGVSVCRWIRRSRSSVQRVLGRPCRRCALSLWSKVGSQCRAIVFHSRLLVRRTFRAYLHLRRLCMVTQSSRRSLCNRASISCVHRLIQSTHGSKHSVGSRSGGAGLGSEVLLSTSSSLVESPLMLLFIALRRSACHQKHCETRIPTWLGIGASRECRSSATCRQGAPFGHTSCRFATSLLMLIFMDSLGTPWLLSAPKNASLASEGCKPLGGTEHSLHWANC